MSKYQLTLDLLMSMCMFMSTVPTEKIDQVIANAIYAMKETQQRIKSELMVEA
jgi:hypothetical protein